MSDWSPQAYSDNSTPVQLDEALLDEEVVIFMTGRNVYGDQTYAYLKLSLRNMHKLKLAMDAGQQFMPSDFGTVLAAGKGQPSDEVKAEMALTYNLIDIPKPAIARPKPSTVQPSVWDEGS